MTLPKKPTREPRPVAVTVKLTEQASKRLKALARENNLSQGEVVEYLVKSEWESRNLK